MTKYYSMACHHGTPTHNFAQAATVSMPGLLTIEICMMALMLAPCWFSLLPITGYCQISCGRCPCCEPLSKTLQRKGYNGFLFLLNLTDVSCELYLVPVCADLISVECMIMRGAHGRIGLAYLQPICSCTPAAPPVAELLVV